LTDLPRYSIAVGGWLADESTSQLADLVAWPFFRGDLAAATCPHGRRNIFRL